MKKVVLTHRLYEDGMKVLDGKVRIAITNTGNPSEMLPELVDADGLIIRIGSIDRKTMLAAKNLKVIGRPGIGVDNVDLATATELGIPVVIAPGANTRSVAEHTLALLFAAAKDITHGDSRTRSGDFNVRNSYRALELAGRTVGIVGFGNIGREFARLCDAIGMKVLVFDPFVPPEVVKQHGYRQETELASLLRSADVVSLHLPLTAGNQRMIGEHELGLMKPDAILINCARGELVDEQALAEALKKGRIHSAAADVLASEPPAPDHPLFGPSNFIITPHMAGLTREAASAVSRLAAEGVLAILDGRLWPHVANRQAYQHRRWLKHERAS